MQQESGATQSTWLDSGDFPPSDTVLPERADVCIIGGGIAGISTALNLLQAGRSVVILEKSTLAGGETCRTTAHLSNVIDDRFTEIERLHGKKGSRLAYESHTAAIRRIEELVQELNIDCEFQRLDGYLIPGENFSDDDMQAEFEASVRAGHAGAEYPARCPVSALTSRHCIRYPGQAQFDPIKYLTAIAAEFQKKGGKIYTHTSVETITENGETVIVKTAEGKEIQARDVVMATNSPIAGSVQVQTKQAPYRTYAISVDVPPNTVSRALYWDTLDAYHYIRLKHGNATGGTPDQLIIGGEDHKAGLDKDEDGGNAHFDRLHSWARTHFPGIGPIRDRWSGQVMEPHDGVAFIGLAPGKHHIYMITGDSGMGMTHATLGAMLITDIISGKENEWAELYKPSRISLRSVGTFLAENMTAVKQLGARLAPGEVHSREDLQPGQAAVVRHGMKKVATYRDENGQFREFSADCTHMGCQVEWNPTEKSWDCPCHGSRFNAEDGSVLNGPAVTPLPPYHHAGDTPA